MTVLAIDPATTFGFALPWRYGTVSCAYSPEPEFKRPGKVWAALDTLALEARERSAPVKAIACEGAAFFARGANAVRVSNEIRGVIKAWAAVHGIDYREVQPQTLKKFATGAGNADKAFMIACAQARLGYTGSDDNEADALWVMEWAKKAA